MKVVLINPYELGRQPFALAQPAAIVLSKKCLVVCIFRYLVQGLSQALLNFKGWRTPWSWILRDLRFLGIV